jgi:hypothetical protein
MSKRLQVVVQDAELERYSRTAESAGMTLSEWARQALRAAEREFSGGDVEGKLAVLRRARNYDFPAPDIDTMLRESEAGYLVEIDDGSSRGPA